MEQYDLINNAGHLLKIALRKCQNADEAKDLVQDTLLAGLLAIARNIEIQNPMAWLTTTLNNKFYDALRQKYNKPTISFDILTTEIVDDNAQLDELIKTEEAEKIRRELAFLSKLYREVMVRFYMNGESVEQIAMALNIPIGTIKSRLDIGRKNIKKGVESMENYSKLSYEPQTLHVSNTNRCGINDEPYSLTAGDKIAQNILIIAYEKPLTEAEISKIIGIPTAYIEPIVKKLVDGQLMVRTSNKKIYTDFILYTEKDRIKFLSEQEEFAEKYLHTIWELMDKYLSEVKNLEYFKYLNIRQQQKVMSFFVVSTMMHVVYDLGVDIYGNYNNDDVPDRPNGGKWFAMGNVCPTDFDFRKTAYYKYRVSGENNVEFRQYKNTKNISLHEYDTELSGSYHQMNIADLMKLLYAIETKTGAAESQIHEIIFQKIPILAQIGIVSLESGKPEVDVPIMTSEQFRAGALISDKAKVKIMENIREPFLELIKKGKQAVPNHLTNIPEFQLYSECMYSIPMAVILKAKGKGMFQKDVDYPCPAMIMVVDK
jgi:RNA polymerase sigma factor (sigma-70 family)